MGRYADEILEIIKRAKSVPHWSITDYLDPLKNLSKKLPHKELVQFQDDLVSLLRGKHYLEEIIQICQEMKVGHAAPLITELLLNPPDDCREDDFSISKESIQMSALVAIGEMHYIKAKPILKEILDAANQKRNLNQEENFYALAIAALVKIDPMESVEYFGWWLHKDRESLLESRAELRRMPDWNKIESLGVLPRLEPTSYFIQNCILALIRAGGLPALEKWLKRIQIESEADRTYLKKQLKILFDDIRHFPMPDIESILKSDIDKPSLIEKLGSLPILKSVG